MFEDSCEIIYYFLFLALL